MKHIYDPREYPYANRKEEESYEIAPSSIVLMASGHGDPDAYNRLTTKYAHNVREAYPELAIATVTVTIPLTLTVVLEGPRLSEANARRQAELYLTHIAPTYREVRLYSSVLRNEAGIILRGADLDHTPTNGLIAPTAEEVDSAREASGIE